MSVVVDEARIVVCRWEQRMRGSDKVCGKATGKLSTIVAQNFAIPLMCTLLTWEQPPPGDILLCAYEVLGGGGNPFRAFAVFQGVLLARIPTARVLSFPPGHFLACMGKHSHNMASSRNLTQDHDRD